MDKSAALQKTLETIAEAADNGASLIALGELWIPGYPSFLYGGSMNDVMRHSIEYVSPCGTGHDSDIETSAKSGCFHMIAQQCHRCRRNRDGSDQECSQGQRYHRQVPPTDASTVRPRVLIMPLPRHRSPSGLHRARWQDAIHVQRYDRLSCVRSTYETDRASMLTDASPHVLTVIIDEHGDVLLHRRKIKPSHYERVLHGDSAGSSAFFCGILIVAAC